MEEPTPYLAGKPKRERLIEVSMTKHTLFLTERELAHLLSLNPALWAKAIRRGKFIRRQRAAERRELHETRPERPKLDTTP